MVDDNSFRCKIDKNYTCSYSRLTIFGVLSSLYLIFKLSCFMIVY